MKKLTTVVLSLLVVASSFAQTVEVLKQYGTAWGGGVEIDMNNNGYLDIVMGGMAGTPRFVEDADGNQVETNRYNWVLMFNPTTKQFESKPTDILNADRPQFIVADFNGDGIMDLVMTEHNRDVLYAPGIYQGKGDGTFEKVQMTFDDANYSFRPVAVNAADLNNDGLVDIVAIGYEKDGEGNVVNSNAVLMNKGNYSFEVTNTSILDQYEVALVFVIILDYNYDGYMDFMVSGNCDNCVSGGHLSFTEIFANLGEDGPGEFYPLSLLDNGIKTKALGGIDIVDYNADGWLDFTIHGEGAGTGEPVSGWNCISHMYINQKNGSFSDKAQPNFLQDLRPLSSVGIGTRAIDWNGNGYYDLIMGGWNEVAKTQTGYLLTNDRNANFNAPVNIPGASELYVLLADWNGDGKKDYFMAGHSWDATFFTTEEVKGRTAALMINNSTVVNQRPTAPTGLNAAVTNEKVTLRWNAATDNETPAAALSYEYYLKKDGKFYTSCRSHVGGALDGVRKVVDLGNAMMNKTITLYNLPAGNYEWGVQAIDASYDGSLFATGTTFTVGPNAVNSTKVDNLFKVYSTGNLLNVKSDEGCLKQTI